jgi:hypothetical protein
MVSRGTFDPQSEPFSEFGCRSAIEIDTRNPEHPKLNLEVVIDGKVAYKWVLRRPFMSASNVDRFALALAAYP